LRLLTAISTLWTVVSWPEQDITGYLRAVVDFASIVDYTLATDWFLFIRPMPVAFDEVDAVLTDDASWESPPIVETDDAVVTVVYVTADTEFVFLSGGVEIVTTHWPVSSVTHSRRSSANSSLSVTSA